MNYTSGGNKGVVPERGKGPAPVPKITGKEDINNDKLDYKFNELRNKIDFKFDLLISKIDNQIKLLWWIIRLLTAGVVFPAIIYVIKTIFLK
ncbi:hypothetical protein [Ligilactobacillus salivarius]|uniref:hypothetical protein n=1 Tax=Ligilactobacillus salivarius TaxID=1624 RepID=UPI001F28AF1C|nr:hypothetical protein [Ligilactobacillus salivarius]MCF2623939.1 hypothetical protein [Ligilactobacillus salivarius]